MNIRLLLAFALLYLAACHSGVKDKKDKPEVNFDSLAITPPMGWNSYDCLGLEATEAQVKETTDFMAKNLSTFGYKYVVIDAGWFYRSDSKTRKRIVTLDEFGRFIPDTTSFPSAKDGHGFKSLADYVHSKGLKFGLHLMRGVPREAVQLNCKIKGTSQQVAEVANQKDSCDWSKLMWGVDMEKPGAQEYYDSVFELFAEWGLDFVKIDDISFPFHEAEIEAVHQAIKKAGRLMVISLSPGPAPVSELEKLAQNAHLWRISDDFWDKWDLVKQQFELCHQWSLKYKPGHWPDADMLPIGVLRKNHGKVSPEAKTTGEPDRFTIQERYTVITLWAIFRSPLILGSYLPENDSLTMKLFTNEEVIAVDQHSANNREIRNNNGAVVWIADQPETHSKYVALFNIGDERRKDISVAWNELGLSGEQHVRDLWAKKDLGKFSNEFTATLEPHECRLLKMRAN